MIHEQDKEEGSDDEKGTKAKETAEKKKESPQKADDANAQASNHSVKDDGQASGQDIKAS